MRFSSVDDESATAMSTYASMSSAAAAPSSTSVADAFATTTTSTTTTAAATAAASSASVATTTASASAFYSPPLPPDDRSVFSSTSANSSSPLYCTHIPAIRIGGREALWRQSSQSTSTIASSDSEIGNESRKIVDSQVGDVNEVCSKDEIIGSSRNCEEGPASTTGDRNLRVVDTTGTYQRSDSKLKLRLSFITVPTTLYSTVLAELANTVCTAITIS